MKRKRRNVPEAVKVGSVSVKIYSRQRKTDLGESRTVFEVADYTGGTRKLRGFNDHKAARKEAERIARQLSSGESTAARMLNHEAASYGRAIELLRPTKTSLEVAVSAYAKAFEILGGDSMIEAARFYSRHRGDQVEKKRISDVVTELIEAKQARGKSDRYIADLRARLTRFAKAFAVDISSVTAPDLQKWLDGLKLASQTARNYRTVLGTLFSFSEQRGYIFKGGNPVQDTEQISANSGPIEIYTPAELVALLEVAPSDFQPVIALCAFAGLRSAEAERIEWREVDLRGGFIHVGGDKAKTRSRRLVKILPNLCDWLATYAKRKGKVWSGTANTIRRARAKTVERSGVAWKDNALRHSFVSYRLADIQNAAQVSLEAGNSPGVVFKHYRELVTREAAQAWFGIRPSKDINIVPLKGVA